MIVDKTGNMKFWLAMAVCLLHSAANAAEVSSEDAVLAARGWAKSGAALGGAPSGEAAGAKAYDGYFVVTFEGGGHVVLAADTDLNPVISWSKDGEWIDDETKNPAMAMMGAISGASGRIAPEAAESNREKWAALIAAVAQPPARKVLLKAAKLQSQPEDDLRVPVLMETKWNQFGAPASDPQPCYNYYTPLNSACGCVATAGAQIMRYHKWPRGEVWKKRETDSYRYFGSVQMNGFSGGWNVWAKECIDDEAAGKTTYPYTARTGYQASQEQVDAGTYTPWEIPFGGIYDWDNMKAVPNDGVTEAERKAIGHLCRDVGLSAYVNYKGGEANAPYQNLAESFVRTFQYADAKVTYTTDSAKIKNALLSNFDAKLPVGVGIPHHAIVADGYGFSGGQCYIHLNYGYGGSASDGWYNLSEYTSESIDMLLYNIHTNGVAGSSIVSGRVLDKNGSPVAGVTVSAKGADSCTTDSHGIYALFLQPGERTIKTSCGSTVATTNLTVTACESPTLKMDGTHTGDGAVGNVWGVDLVLQEASETELGWINETAETTGLTGEWSNGIAYDQTTRRAELSGENTFMPLLPSGGNAATLDFTAKFDALTDDLSGMDSDAQMAFCIGANGKFRLWSGGAWVDVSAEGVTPAPDVEYAVRVVFNYKSGCYSASVRDSGGTFRPLLDASANGNFKISAKASHVGSVIMRGDCLFASLVGTYYTVSGFSPGDVTGEDAQITLSEAHAAWLNALAEDRGYVSVSNGVARLSAARFETAYLCNLDVTRDDFDATFGVTGIAVDDEKVAIEVTLERTGAVQSGGKDAPINGVLRFYGAATVEAFRSALSEKTPLADVTLSNDDFAGGETATAEIGRTPDSGDKFFKAEIGGK